MMRNAEFGIYVFGFNSSAFKKFPPKVAKLFGGLAF